MSWPKVKLSDISEIVTGSTPSTSNIEFYGGDIPFITPTQLDKDTFVSAAETYVTQAGANAARLIPENSVMVCCIGSLGKVGISARPLITNQQINSLIINASVADPLYVYFYCRTLAPVLEHMAPKTTVAIVNKSRFSDLSIPLPPLETQKHIARVLEQADQLRKQAQQMESELNQLAQSLFLEMFGNLLRNPKKWPLQSLGSLIVDGPKNGLYKHADDYGSGTPIIRIDNFYSGELTSSNSFKRVDVTEIELEKFKVRENSLLINRVNSPEYLGKAALVENLQEPTVFESNMMNFSVDTNKVNPQFLVTQLGSQFVREQIRKASKDAVNQSSINQGDVQSFVVVLPPIDEQNAFAKRLREIRSVRTMCIGNKSVVDDLFNALMQRAFNGELTAPGSKAA